jgi:hypothetical protein
MIRLLILICFISFQKEEPPYKAKEDFEIKLEMSFKQRTHHGDSRTVLFNEDQVADRPVEGLLPTLKLNIKIVTVQESEIKLKVIKDDAAIVYRKNVEQGMEFKLDLGFTDDLKDRVEGYRHVIQFFSAEKKVVSKIVIEFDEDGNYYVNGEKLGKV